jgi:hypothetical protein
MRLVGHTANTGESRKAQKILVGKPEWKTQLGRSRHRCEDNDIGCENVDWIQLAQDRG